MITALFFTAIIANAEPVPKTWMQCSATDAECLLPFLDDMVEKIDNTSWRDQILRETAKLYAAKNMLGEALKILPQIRHPDTRALTIRGIGVAAAKLDMPEKERDALFVTLLEAAKTIDHKPSYAIALTYISMAQALAGDNEGAYSTAASMENTALRRKAFAESAEIQAERGDIEAALHNLSAIDDAGFRNKAYATTARVLAAQGNYAAALTMTEKIDNAYLQSWSLLYILAQQITPHDTGFGIKE